MATPISALGTLILAVEPDGAPDPALVDALFEMSIDIYGNIIDEDDAVDAFRLLVLLFPSLSMSSKLLVLSKFKRLAGTSFANLAALTDDDLGLIPFLVRAASDPLLAGEESSASAIAALLSSLLLYDVRVADVTSLLRALKPTLRGFRPSGRNLVLTTLGTVIAEPEDPPVFWAFDGRDSGLVLPDLPGWPSGGYSVAMWLRVEEFLGGSRVFSFLSESGAGFEACFAKAPDSVAAAASSESGVPGFVLVVRSVSRKAKDNYQAGSFVFDIRRWYHVTVTHLEKTFSRSEVCIYVDGALVDTLAVKYPSLKSVPMTQCSVATNVAAVAAGRPAHSLHGQLGSGYLYGSALSASDVAQLYALGPARVVASPLPSAASALMFAFHPRGFDASLGLTVYNLACPPGSVLDPDVHAAVLRGSDVMSGTRLRHVFNAVGGLNLLLPLFGQLDLPSAPSDMTGPALEVTEDATVAAAKLDGAALWALVARLVRVDPAAAAALASPPTLRLIGYLLSACAPQALGDILLPSLTPLLDFAVAAHRPTLRFHLLHELVLNGALWSRVPEPAMKARLALISAQVKADPAYFRATFGVTYFLDAIADAYVATGSAPSPAPLHQAARRCLLKAIKNMIGPAPLEPFEVEALVRFMVTAQDPDAIVEVEQLVLVFVLGSSAFAPFMQVTNPPPEPLTALLAGVSHLLAAEASVSAGLFALKLALGVLVSLTRAGSPKKLARFIDATGFGVPLIEASLRAASFTPLTYNILLAGACGHVSLHMQETALPPGSSLVLPDLYVLTLDLVASSPSVRLKEKALQDTLLLVRHSPESRSALAALPNWECALAAIMMAAVVHGTASQADPAVQPYLDLLPEALAQSVVFELGSTVFFLVLRPALAEPAGSAALAATYSRLVSFARSRASPAATTFIHSLLVSVFGRVLDDAHAVLTAASSANPDAPSSSSNPFAEPAPSSRGVAATRANVTDLVALVEELAFAFPLEHPAVPSRAGPTGLPRDSQGRWVMFPLASSAVDAAMAASVPLPSGTVAAKPPLVTLGDPLARALGSLLLTVIEELDPQFADDARLMQLQNELLGSAVTLGSAAVHDYSKAGELHRVVYDHLRRKLAARTKVARRKLVTFENRMAQLLQLVCGTDDPGAACRLPALSPLGGVAKGLVCRAMAFVLGVLATPGSAFLAEDTVSSVCLTSAGAIQQLHRASLSSLPLDVLTTDWSSEHAVSQVVAFAASFAAAHAQSMGAYVSATVHARSAALDGALDAIAAFEAGAWKLAKVGAVVTGPWLDAVMDREARRRALHLHAMHFDARESARLWAAVYRSLTLSTASWAVVRASRKVSLDLRERADRTRVRLIVDDSVMDHSPALVASRSHGDQADSTTAGPGDQASTENAPLADALEGLVLNTSYNPATGLSTPSKADDEPGASTEAGDQTDGDTPDAVAGLPTARAADLVVSAAASITTFFADIPGAFEVTRSRMFFRRARDGSAEDAVRSALSGYQADAAALTGDLLRDRAWELGALTKIHRRRILLRWRGLELFFSDGSSVLLAFASKDEASRVAKDLIGLAPPLLVETHLRSPPELVARSKLTDAWVRREISNFDYLMALNTFAGRSHHDLSQYPVFPWILADYTSETLDLDDPAAYRDLSKPIGALDPERLAYFEERYASLAEADPDLPAFHYGSHYSSPGVVLYYLTRIEPFTTAFAHFNGGKFDHADRMFHKLAITYDNVLHSTADVKELIPEFFYLPEMLENVNQVAFGVRQDGETMDDVVLPPWASSAHEFVTLHRQALESDYVSAHLHEWIDLIFGYKQRGDEAIAATNVFHYMTYEGVVDLDAIDDPMQLAAAEAQIANFGQTPALLFGQPHPARQPRPDAKLGRPLSMGPGTDVDAPGGLVALKPLEVRSYSALRGSSTASHVFVGVTADQTVVIVDADGAKGVLGTETSLAGNIAERMSVSRKQMQRCVAVVPASAYANTQGDTQVAVFPQVARVDRGTRSRIDASPELVLTAGHTDNSLGVHTVRDDLTVRPLRRVAVGMDSVILALAVSPSGGVAVTGCAQSQVLVWRINPRADVPLTVVSMLCGHESEVVAVAVDAGQDLVVSGATDGRVLLHALSDGEVLHELVGVNEDDGPVEAVALSSVGQIVTYHSDSCVLRVFAANGALLCREDVGVEVTSIAVCGTGQYLYLSTEETVIEVRALPLLDMVHVYDPVGSAIVDVAASAATGTIGVGLASGRVVVGGGWTQAAHNAAFA